MYNFNKINGRGMRTTNVWQERLELGYRLFNNYLFFEQTPIVSHTYILNQRGAPKLWENISSGAPRGESPGRARSPRVPLKETYYGVFPTRKHSIWVPENMFLKLFAENSF